MTEVLTASSLNHLMCSQSGNISDLAACSGHSPSCIIGSDSEPDSSSRQEYNPPSLHSDMGLRYMTIPATDDVRFSQDAGNSHSSVYSIESTGQNQSSAASTLSFSPYANLYQSSLGSSTYTSGNSSYFSPSPSLFSSMPDLKPRSGSYTTSSNLSSRSPLPHLSHPTSPISARDIYTSATPYQRRTDQTRSPTLLGTVRGGIPISPTSSGFASPMSAMDGSLGGGNACPPLFATEVIYSLQTTDGSIIKPEIFGRIDKGFFMADNDWTCYRRNYFSLQCSYTLTPTIPTGSLFLVQHSGVGPQVHNFAISIAAVVDGKDGKAIELVQHTPKRDKGPQEKPARITLSPRPAAPHGIYGDSTRAGLYGESGFSSNPNQPAIEATFERIQFKNATANNGKRRAAQQYYHLLVELFADVGQSSSSSSSDRWVKIASRMSAQMVVRGRSPGHYQNERRGSNTSSGPGGSGGGAGSYTPGGGNSSRAGDMGMSGSSSMLPGSAYSGSYDTRSSHYRSAGLNIPMEPTLSTDEARGIVEPSGYLYCPGAIYEGAGSTAGAEERFLQLPSMVGYGAKFKSEFSGLGNSSSHGLSGVSHSLSSSSHGTGYGGSSGSGYGGHSGTGMGSSGSGGYMLPSLSSTQGGHCGRWEGSFESKGFFPNALMQGELNIT